MFLKLYVLIFWFKMLHVLSFSSSKFEFLNMHISLSNFSRHMCDVIGVNRSMKQESVKALDQLSSPVTNRWTIIIQFSTKFCPTGAVWIRWGQDWSKTRCCSWRPSTHRRCGFCHPDPEKPALSAKKADVSINLLFFKSNIILLCYIAIYGNGPEIYRHGLWIH